MTRRNGAVTDQHAPSSETETENGFSPLERAEFTEGLMRALSTGQLKAIIAYARRELKRRTAA